VGACVCVGVGAIVGACVVVVVVASQGAVLARGQIFQPVRVTE
jgi:hypothetical protein